MAEVKSPLILILPMGERYTLEEVKVGHWLLWDFISKSDRPLDKPLDARKLLRNGCYACEYTKGASTTTKRNCCECPINWGLSENDACTYRESSDWFSSYDDWSRLPYFADQLEKARELARAVRDVSWKDGVVPNVSEALESKRFKTKIISNPRYLNDEEELNNG